MITTWIENDDDHELPLDPALDRDMADAWVGLRVGDGVRAITMRGEAAPFAGRFGAALASRLRRDGHAVAHLWSEPGAFRFDLEGAAVRVEDDDGTWVRVPAAALYEAQRRLTRAVADGVADANPRAAELLRAALAEEALSAPGGPGEGEPAEPPATSGRVAYGPIHRSRGVSAHLDGASLRLLAGGPGLTATLDDEPVPALGRALTRLRANEPTRLAAAEGPLRFEPSGAVTQVRLPGQRVLELGTDALVAALARIAPTAP